LQRSMYGSLLLVLLMAFAARSLRLRAVGLRSSAQLFKAGRASALHMSIAEETIFALSSGPMVKTGVSVVRISGPAAQFCLQTLCTPPSGTGQRPADPKPRFAALRRLYSPCTADLLDQALVLWFPGPRSFTGEDVVELHLHGSKAVIRGVFEALEHLDDPTRVIRPAGAGEFTRRAFERGKMDLTEVEGLGDLLDAETGEQRKQALRQMEGYLRKQYEAWR
jgi:tRNA modification GTPase